MNASAMAQRLEVHFQEVHIEKVFDFIEKKTDYRFLYDARAMKAHPLVSLDVQQADIGACMERILDKAFVYRILSNNLVVVTASTENVQEITVTGQVLSADDQPLEGSSIRVKGLTKGCVTDAQGRFSITVPDNVQLLVSRIGFQQMITPVKGKMPLQIKLAYNEPGLQEVVVTSMGIRKEAKKIGYAIKQVKGEELQAVRTANPVNALAGKVAGLRINYKPGFFENPDVLLRGERPMVVIDGVPVSTDFYDVNPDDIADITILKGPAASVLYGSYGRNGAVMITTIRGPVAAEDKLEVVLHHRSTFQAGWVAIPSVQNEYGNGNNGKYLFKDGKGGGINDGDYVWGPKLDQRDPSTPSGYVEIPQWNSPVNQNGELVPLPWISRGKNNLSNFLQLGMLENLGVMVAARNDRSVLRFSLDHLYQRGQLPYTQLHNSFAAISVNYKLSSKLSVDAVMNYNRQFSPNYPRRVYSPVNQIYTIILWMGADVGINDMKNYWKPGQEGIQQRNWNYSWYNNPWFMAKEHTQSWEQDKTYGNVSLNLDVLPGLQLKLRQGLTVTGKQLELHTPKSLIYYSDDTRGNFQLTQENMLDATTDLMAAYTRRWGKIGMSANAGVNMYYFKYRQFYAETDGLNVPGLYNLANSTRPVYSNNIFSEKRTSSAYATTDIDYGNYLFLNLSGRIDRTSTLPLQHNTYFYPSVGISIVPTAMANFPEGISFIKLRAALANVFHDLQPYQLYGTYDKAEPYGSIGIYDFSGDLRNADIRPMQSIAFETGMDLLFLKGRLGLNMTYYNTWDKNDIIPINVSTTSGFDTYLVNGNEYRRKGLEIEWMARPVAGKHWQWESNFNWSMYRRYLKDVYRTAEEIAAGNETTLNGIRIGERMDIVRGTRWMRTSSGALVIGKDGLPEKDPVPHVLGYMNPDWELGWSNKVTWQRFTLSWNLNVRMGGLIASTTFFKLWESGRHPDAVGPLRDAAYRGETWLAPGMNVVGGELVRDVAGNVIKDTRIYTENQYGVNWILYQQVYNRDVDEQYTFDASFLKLRELALAYKFTAPKNNRKWLKGMTLTLTGSNLLLLCKVPFVDPDGVTDNYLQEPSQRNIGINAQFNF
ncbi:SusC/RagA family TonB-linked outer membrane protein [Chitinophaga defluvii]|uniref:SusC/RagA family TonB-linked outer membrane protein n=1 Tax=Chitinophaga defluvii TaxID=3163343 RepID=A0ABV2T4T5_9BACT